MFPHTQRKEIRMKEIERNIELTSAQIKLLLAGVKVIASAEGQVVVTMEPVLEKGQTPADVGAVGPKSAAEAVRLSELLKGAYTVTVKISEPSPVE
jgi:succinyl-CoA synthetase beta subunit